MSAVGAHSVRPSSVDHDARRARRLGAPPYKVSPFWASSFFRGEKGTKTPPGETHIAVRNRFPPAPARSPPDPRNLREPNSSSLPVTVRRGRGNDCPRNRAAAAAGLKSRWPGRLEQTGAPDRSGSNLCGGESAGGSACSLPGNVSPLSRRGGACPSRRILGMAVVRRRGAQRAPAFRGP